MEEETENIYEAGQHYSSYYPGEGRRCVHFLHGTDPWGGIA